MSPSSHQSRVDSVLESVSKLVFLGLRQHQLSGITKMLECVANECGAAGLVLWELSSDPSVPDGKPSFFTLAQWNSEGTNWGDSIPVESVVGYVVMHQIPYYAVCDLQNPTEPHVYRGPVLHGVRSMCVVPVIFADGARGALSLYKSEVQPFTASDEDRLCRMVALLPALFETIRDEVAFKLSRELNDALQEADLERVPESDWDKEFRKTISRICTLIGRRLEIQEVSVFLSVPNVARQYSLYGSTLSYESKDSPVQMYQPAEEDLTAAALVEEGKTIRVLDLNSSSLPEPMRADQDYIRWMRSFVSDRPLSFVATPILAGGAVLGVIRFCALMVGPTFFAQREATLFELLAGQIGQYVSSQRSRRELKRENSEWRVLVDSVSDVVGFVHDEIVRPQPAEEHIYKSSLRMIANVMPGASFVDIRVRRLPGSQLVQMSVQGWNKHSPKPVPLPQEWLGTLEHGGVIDLFPELGVPFSYDEYRRTLPSDLKRLIIAPIVSNDQFSILEIGQSGSEDFPKHAPIIAKLIGQQLSLYHSFAIAIGRLKRTEGELKKKIDAEKKTAKAQTQTFMDLEHQLKTPLLHARSRIPIALRIAAGQENEPIQKQLLFLRGILRRASRVATSIGLFAELANEDTICLNKTPLSLTELPKILIEAAMDSQVLADEKTGLTFGYEEDALCDLPKAGKLDVDINLLDQAINNLLDNAAKYSFNGQRVRITANATKNRVCIAVSSRGLNLDPASVESAKERGWRSPLARLTTGEGSGIGLWIVNNIMKAHGGELIIVPTSPKGITEVRLLFPLAKG